MIETSRYVGLSSAIMPTIKTEYGPWFMRIINNMQLTTWFFWIRFRILLYVTLGTWINSLTYSGDQTWQVPTIFHVYHIHLQMIFPFKCGNGIQQHLQKKTWFNLINVDSWIPNI